MTNHEVLYGLNEWLIIPVLAVLFYIASEIGFRYGRHMSTKKEAKSLSANTTLESAMFSLLVLLLGFTFLMAMTRYDARKDVLLQEANDIQTTYLRTELLPVKYQEESQRLLREYVESRLSYYDVGIEQKKIKASLKQAEEIQSLLWSTAVKAVEESSNQVIAGYYISSLNNMIDDYSKRLTATRNHVPESVLFLLIFMTIVTLATNGYINGIQNTTAGKRRLALILLISTTLMLIIDLDRPRRGFIKVSQDSLRAVQAAINQ